MADKPADATMQAVRDKLNVTWESEETDRRLRSVVDTVTPVLNSRLGYPDGHGFTPADGGPWALFLNACLYEFSGALDDFWVNYACEIRAERLLILCSAKGEEDGDAQGQG